MVGVPRSRGCLNCRRKKNGCDLQRPVCGQCTRLGFECGYEDKKWTFVNQQPERVVACGSKPNSRGPTSTETFAVPNDSLIRSLESTGFHIGSLGEFWEEYMPHEPTGVTYIGEIRTIPWMHTLREMSNIDPTVHTAFNAVAFTVLGRSRSDHRLLQEGTVHYARALRQTNKALQDPQTAQSDTVLEGTRTSASSGSTSLRLKAGIGATTLMAFVGYFNYAAHCSTPANTHADSTKIYA